MIHAIQEIVEQLKAARKKKGLSQRKFAEITGMQQSRLSRIENCLVDLQASTLLEIARALDLELMLVPKKTVPGVTGMIRQVDSKTESRKMKPMYRLDEDNDD